MKQIPLTQDMFAIVDDEDYEILSQYKWCAMKNGNVYYATRREKKSINPKRATTYMQWGVIGKKEGFVIDHINGNGLDNRRCNLRYVTHRQNMQNLQRPMSSKYPGVYWHKRSSSWVARIRVKDKRFFLGCYINEIDAFNAYKKAVNGLSESVITGGRGNG